MGKGKSVPRSPIPTVYRLLSDLVTKLKDNKSTILPAPRLPIEARLVSDVRVSVTDSFRYRDFSTVCNDKAVCLHAVVHQKTTTQSPTVIVWVPVCNRGVAALTSETSPGSGSV